MKLKFSLRKSIITVQSSKKENIKLGKVLKDWILQKITFRLYFQKGKR